MIKHCCDHFYCDTMIVVFFAQVYTTTMKVII